MPIKKEVFDDINSCVNSKEGIVKNSEDMIKNSEGVVGSRGSVPFG